MKNDMKKWMLAGLVALPLYGCSDSVAPTWSDGAEATADLNESDIIVKWPDATDDKGVAAYRVMVDGQLGVETNADARNWTSANLPVGADHNFEIIAVDIAGNESEPLTLTWEARDVDGPTWPVGSLVKVERKAPAGAEAAPGEDTPGEGTEGEAKTEEKSDDALDLVLSWPDATDESSVAFYRVVLVPSVDDSKNVRPKLIGVVKEGNSIETSGLPSSRFQVYAIDTADNASKPIIGALDNPTRFDPFRNLKNVDLRKDGEIEETPKVGKGAAERAAQNQAEKTE